jgi:hypothetical protein
MSTKPRPTREQLIERRVGTIAVLQAFWTTSQQSYVDMFMPFVMRSAVSLAQSNESPTVDALRSDIADSIGMLIPRSAIETVIRRAGHRALGTFSAGVFTPSDSASTYAVRAEQIDDARRHQNALFRAFQKYAAEQLQVNLSESESHDLLVEYLAEHASSLLAASFGRRSALSINPEKHFAAASWVLDVLEYEPETANNLKSLVVGTILAAALFLPDLEQRRLRFTNLNAFLDTPTLLDALGHAGPLAEETAREYLQLLRDAGARLNCFDHTEAEIKRVLYGVGDTIANAQASQFVPHGGVYEYAMARGLSSGDLHLAATRVRDDLQKIAVTVDEHPAAIAALTVDESNAAEVLRSKLKYKNDAALHADLDSLTSIYRLRNGRPKFTLDDCTALFVTSNMAVVTAGREIFYGKRDCIPVVMPMNDLATIAWLRQPRLDDSLPLRRLALDCYVTMRPTSAFIEKVIEVSEGLVDRGDVSPNDALALRYGLDERRILMRATFGNQERIDGDALTSALSQREQELRQAAIVEARQELSQSAMSAFEEAEARERELLERIEQLSKQSDDLVRADEIRIERQAQRKAHRLAFTAVFVVSIPAVALAVLTFPVIGAAVSRALRIQEALGHVPRVVGVIAAVVALLWMVAALKAGTSLDSAVQGLEKRLLPHTQRRIQQQSRRDGHSSQRL